MGVVSPEPLLVLLFPDLPGAGEDVRDCGGEGFGVVKPPEDFEMDDDTATSSSLSETVERGLRVRERERRRGSESRLLERWEEYSLDNRRGGEDARQCW